jgi:hypothetical protein
MHIETLRSTIASAERDNENLTAQYGTGVRPSWVGIEIVLNLDRIDRYKKLLADELTKQGEPK